eukprot:364597-Chlamydomonas_euryale.AAC.17
MEESSLAIPPASQRISRTSCEVSPRAQHGPLTRLTIPAATCLASAHRHSTLAGVAAGQIRARPVTPVTRTNPDSSSPRHTCDQGEPRPPQKPPHVVLRIQA